MQADHYGRYLGQIEMHVSPYNGKVYDFNYKEDPICYSNNNTSINFCEWIPTETGSYTVVVNVTDASNFSVSYSKQFIVT